MFRLNFEEAKSVLLLRSQIATLKRGEHLKYAPYVFTEHGAVMLANVLKSNHAVQASIKVGKHDEQLIKILKIIHQLLMPPPLPSPKGDFGFKMNKK
jgi:hypothetical protein